MQAVKQNDAAPTQFHGIMTCLYPVMIRLAASTEPVAQQLFEPLIMSLIHWYTRTASRSAFPRTSTSCTHPRVDACILLQNKDPEL